MERTMGVRITLSFQPLIFNIAYVYYFYFFRMDIELTNKWMGNKFPLRMISEFEKNNFLKVVEFRKTMFIVMTILFAQSYLSNITVQTQVNDKNYRSILFYSFVFSFISMLMILKYQSGKN